MKILRILDDPSYKVITNKAKSLLKVNNLQMTSLNISTNQVNI